MRPVSPTELKRLPLARRVGGLIVLSLFCEIAFALVVTVALPLYLGNDLGWKEKMIGPVTSAFLLTETACKPFWAHLSDIVGRKPLIAVGIAISATAVLAMANTTSFPVFVALSAINGLGGGAIWPSVFAGVADVTSDSERVHAMSVFNMMYMVGLGGGVVLKSVIARTTDKPSEVFPVTACLFGAALLVTLVAVPWVRASAHHNPHGTPDQRHRLAWPVLAFFCVLSFFQTFGLQLHNGPLIRYVNQDLGLKETDIGLPFIALGAAVIVAAVPIGSLGGRIGRVRSVLLGLATASIGMLLLPLNASLAWFIIVAIPMVFGFLLSIPAWLAVITDLAPEAWRGRVYGLVATTQGAGAILGPMVGFWLRDDVSHAMPFYLSGGILLATFVAAAFVLREGMKAVVEVPARVT
jgi:MFS family permease